MDMPWIKMDMAGLMEWRYFHHPNTLKVFLCLLYYASDYDHPGIAIVSKGELAKAARLTVGAIDCALKNLQKGDCEIVQIGEKKQKSRFRIANWEKYQTIKIQSRFNQEKNQEKNQDFKVENAQNQSSEKSREKSRFNQDCHQDSPLPLNNTLYKEEELEDLNTTRACACEATQHFPRPKTPQEVQNAALLQGKRWDLDECQRFIDYYEALGWKKGAGTNIVNWTKLIGGWDFTRKKSKLEEIIEERKREEKLRSGFGI